MATRTAYSGRGMTRLQHESITAGSSTTRSRWKRTGRAEERGGCWGATGGELAWGVRRSGYQARKGGAMTNEEDLEAELVASYIAGLVAFRIRQIGGGMREAILAFRAARDIWVVLEAMPQGTGNIIDH